MTSPNSGLVFVIAKALQASVSLGGDTEGGLVVREL
jgi:hypothetical protein